MYSAWVFAPRPHFSALPDCQFCANLSANCAKSGSIAVQPWPGLSVPRMKLTIPSTTFNLGLNWRH